eukprot:TRINITY_DN15035_c0_g1_i1.p1 TRINITY_DN15035_c0_g1~~TRINITY_DN15035_c0_g1_i1.p1  ORF type:complete len:463 (+),score=49.69 TRINITY_DN15035_c0_g1_i1:106-1494(+)
MPRGRIEIQKIENKQTRAATFSKRKAGLMKKSYELSVLTGCEVLTLVASETGHVYTFATPKLQPAITTQAGKELFQKLLNAEAPELPPSTVPAAVNPFPASESFESDDEDIDEEDESPESSPQTPPAPQPLPPGASEVELMRDQLLLPNLMRDLQANAIDSMKNPTLASDQAPQSIFGFQSPTGEPKPFPSSPSPLTSPFSHTGPSIPFATGPTQPLTLSPSGHSTADGLQSLNNGMMSLQISASSLLTSADSSAPIHLGTRQPSTTSLASSSTATAPTSTAASLTSASAFAASLPPIPSFLTIPQPPPTDTWIGYPLAPEQKPSAPRSVYYSPEVVRTAMPNVLGNCHSSVQALLNDLLVTPNPEANLLQMLNMIQLTLANVRQLKGPHPCAPLPDVLHQALQHPGPQFPIGAAPTHPVPMMVQHQAMLQHGPQVPISVAQTQPFPMMAQSPSPRGVALQV